MKKELTGLEKHRKKVEKNLLKLNTGDVLTPKEVSVLLHELRIYQQDLEKQNQELQVMQQKLELARDQYADLFEFAPVGYFILNTKGVIINVNLTGCQLIGIEQQKLKGKLFSDFTSKSNGDANKFSRYLKNIFASATINSIDLSLKLPNGNEFQAQLEGIVIPGENQNPCLCRLTLRDITHEKRTALLEQLNEQLRKEKETARQYLEMAGVIFVALDPEGVITMINQKGCEILGYKKAKHKKSGVLSEKIHLSLLGMNWIDVFIPEKERDYTREIFKKLNKNGPVQEYFENEIIGIDGIPRTISWHNSILRDPDGNFIGTLSAGTDITLRKQEEKKLTKALEAQKESEQHFRKIFENANDAFSIIDAKTYKVINANSKLLNRLGYTRKEILKLKIADLYKIENSEFADRLFREIYEKNQVLFEGNQLRKDGTVVPVEVSSCMTEFGGKKAFLSISRDISERKKVESMLMANLLEGQEKERQRIAVDLHDSIQPLLATIKRKVESLNPVNTSPVAEKIKDYKSAKTLLEKTFKEIKVISHNLVPPSLKDFGLVATIRDLCESMDQPGKLKVKFYSAGMNGIEDGIKQINYHVATGLYRIAQESLYNAIKHSKAKTITLQLVRHNKSFVLMIEDDGTGFEEPFKKKGLGISSMSARVKMMDGTFDIDSLKGRGTIITVEVPLAVLKN